MTEKADLKLQRKRIVWENSSMRDKLALLLIICMLQKILKRNFKKFLIEEIKKENYTDNVDHYCKIINGENFDRLEKDD